MYNGGQQVAKILIVEDDIDLNNAYRIILTHDGHEVVSAFDGKEALKKLNQNSPDLILLDLLMPIMGGLEFLQESDLTRNHLNTRVLIFTNMENSPEVAAAYELGAHRCIIKSWTAPHNLAQIVTDTLKKDAKQIRKTKATA